MSAVEMNDTSFGYLSSIHGPEEANEFQKKVLIVDDDVDYANLFQLRLERNRKYKVIRAVNGYDGAIKAELELPDLVIMDLNMPCCGGDESLRLLKTSWATMSVPVICLSAEVKTGEHREGYDFVVNKKDKKIDIFEVIKSLVKEINKR